MTSFLGFGNAPNVLTGGATDRPDWTPTNLDQGTVDLINQELAQGNLTPAQIAAQSLQGTQKTMGSAVGGAVGQQQSALGGASDDATTAALNDRANRLYAAQYNQLQNAAIAGAPARQGQLQSQAMNALQQQQNVNDQLNQMQMQVTLNKEAVRNNIIGQLFGGFGNYVGAYRGMQNQNPTAAQYGSNSDQDYSGGQGGESPDIVNPLAPGLSGPEYQPPSGSGASYNVPGNGMTDLNSGNGLNYSYDGIG